MLVEDTLYMCSEYLTSVWREETAENRAQTFHSLVLHRKLQTVVRWITERDTGGPSSGRPLYKDKGPV